MRNVRVASFLSLVFRQSPPHPVSKKPVVSVEDGLGRETERGPEASSFSLSHVSATKGPLAGLQSPRAAKLLTCGGVHRVR